MHGLAPAAFLSHVISPSVRAIVPFLPIVQVIIMLIKMLIGRKTSLTFNIILNIIICNSQRVRALIGINYIKASKKFRILAGELLCRDKVPTQAICSNILFLVMGYDSDQMNTVCLIIFKFIQFSPHQFMQFHSCC